MHKKLAATLTIAIFLISTLAIIAPVSAHFTLGNLPQTYRYHANDFDPHMAGVIGYVWPGGGLNAYTGAPNVWTNQLSPGYQSPYPGANPPGAPQNVYQLEGDTYAPFGAILTDSTGDLIFAVNATAGFNGGDARFSTLNILIPPEFTIPDESQVVTTLTNNGAFIRVYKLGPLDAYAPGWTLVKIYGDRSSVFAGGTDQIGTGARITFSGRGEWYYVRVNGVTAPAIAGRYFFKMYLSTTSTSTGVILNPGGLPAGNYFVPVQNWPVLLVKGEIDPAIITGTIRYGGYNATLYGQGVGEAGRVWAKMTTRLDPYTGQQRPDLPTVDAVGYFNATARGHYEVEGLAPGVYDLYAQAAGFPQMVVASGVTVLKGQSLHFDGYLQPGPVIHGNLYTKHQFGEEPWPVECQAYPVGRAANCITSGGAAGHTVGEYVKVELYSGATVNHIPDASAGSPVSWSPLPCVAGGRDVYSPGFDAALCGDPRRVNAAGVGINVAFPWHEYTLGNGYANSPAAALPNQPGGGAGMTQNAPGLYSDPVGVGPPQTWVTDGGTVNPFHFEFGVKGEYGAPRDMDGHVPQVFATWVNGLTAQRYYARAWVFRYVQAALDGSTFQEYSFDVTPNEWAGDITLPIDLRLSSWVNKTVHFHNLPGTITTDSINTGANFLVGGLFDTNNILGGTGASQKVAWNATYLPANPIFGATAAYPNHGPLDPFNLNAFCNTPGRPEFGSCNIQFWGLNDTWAGQNYGIPSGTYNVKVYALGYLQQTTETVSVTLSGNPTLISDHMYRGVGFNLTAYSIDWERPRVNRNWLYDDGAHGTDIEVAILDAQGGFVSEICYGCDIGAASGDAGLANAFYDRYYGGFVPRPVDFATGGLYDLFQNWATYHVQMDGGGRNILPNDNAHSVFFGLDDPYPLVGGYWSRTGGLHSGFTTKNDWRAWKASFFVPSAFDSGQYGFRGFTFGYIQNKNFDAYGNKGQVLDIKLNLIIGVNVTIDILFKKEGLIFGTPNPMQARLRLFNEQGSLVAEWFSSMGVDEGVEAGIEPTPHHAVADTVPGTPVEQGFQAEFGDDYNYLPGGTTLLRVPLHGLPAYEGDFGDNIFTPFHGDFEVDMWGDVTHFPNAGILGAPDYTGGWTAEADFVNIYANNTGPNQGALNVTNFYPPVQGLLMGESYHIIPGTAAKSGISFTEDGALDSFFLGHTMAPNHLGPYSQQGVWLIPGAHNSGESSAIFEVDLNGLVSGNALAFTWSNEFRPLSWGLVSVTGASGASWNFYTYDGIYQAFLPPGSYKFTISSPGLASQTFSVSVSAGQTGNGLNAYLEQSNIPVPEFSGIAIVAFSALAASLYLLRRRRQ